MLEIALTREEPWPEADWDALAERAAQAAIARTPHGELLSSDAAVEVSFRLTSDDDVRTLNAQYRHKDKATNVLSFPAFPETKSGPLPPLLGDIVLAAETVAGEAALEGKPLENHISHLVVHGLLHLLGYDHETEAEADEMEATERRILARLAIPDPYA